MEVVLCSWENPNIDVCSDGKLSDLELGDSVVLLIGNRPDYSLGILRMHFYLQTGE